MRRFLLCGALLSAVVVSTAAQAFAQFYQQRPIPQAPVPTVNRFAAVNTSPATPVSAPSLQDPLGGVGTPFDQNGAPKILPLQLAQRGGGGNGGGGNRGGGNQGGGNPGNRGGPDRGNTRGSWHSGHHHHGHWHPRFRNDFGWGWWSVGVPWGWNVGYIPWNGVPWYGNFGPPVTFSYFGVNVVDPVFSQPVVNAPVVDPPVGNPPGNAGPVPAATKPEPAKSKIRASNNEQKARAGKFVGYGDTNFARQKYLAAIDRYKTAIEVAPDMPESYLRQGVGLVAMGQYANATKAFRRGLKVSSAWSGLPFHLDALYGQAPLVKSDHLERLAKAVEANPLDADPLVALGMMLLLDGQADRANLFFARAVQLGGNDDGSLSVLLPQADPQAAGQPGGTIKF